ncbi:MAG: hypothetical protein MOGMAGMI_01994 [Candidatus Omnitrophica bacterium]|nr:hypothetical protein [Candidatus Omnitrophota bacterium]
MAKTKEDRIQVRVATAEKKAIIQEGKAAGHSSASAFLLWLYRNWKSGSLVPAEPKQ